MRGFVVLDVLALMLMQTEGDSYHERYLSYAVRPLQNLLGNDSGSAVEKQTPTSVGAVHSLGWTDLFCSVFIKPSLGLLQI